MIRLHGDHPLNFYAKGINAQNADAGSKTSTNGIPPEPSFSLRGTMAPDGFPLEQRVFCHFPNINCRAM